MRTILHLCADLGSDSRYYQVDSNYEVIKVGQDIGVENYKPDRPIHGVIANPPCTDFSIASGFDQRRDLEDGLFLVKHCERIIKLYKPEWWVIENPARSRIKEYLGAPQHTYEPWEYGTPWTKRTGLWGSFSMPKKRYEKWEDVPKNPDLYCRPGRPKPSLAFLHKSAIQFCPEYEWAKPHVKTDADFRSLCSDGFAKDFKEANP